MGRENEKPDEAEVEKRLKEMERLGKESEDCLRGVERAVDIAEELVETAKNG